MKLIDGSEVDYYFDESTLWTHARSDQKAGWYGLSPENYGKFANIDTAASVYLNMLLGRQSCPFLAPNTFGYYNELTEDDFQRWCEHNIYHGLLSTDEYVWVYSEAMSWWGNKPIKSVNKEVFPGAEEAVVWASNQFRQGKALGWDMVRTSAQFGLSQNPLLAGPDRTVRPEIVSSPEIRLTASTNGSVIDNGSSISAGAAVILSVSVDAGSPVQRVEFYDNSERTDWTLWAPNFSAVRATPGAHTFVARAHLADGGHVTSNPVFAQVR